jgi:hypothetical protein
VWGRYFFQLSIQRFSPIKLIAETAANKNLSEYLAMATLGSSRNGLTASTNSLRKSNSNINVPQVVYSDEKEQRLAEYVAHLEATRYLFR